jgi:ABC-type multidrug transport system fused ATPase/permease subunit
MNLTNLELARLLDHLIGSKSDYGRVRELWYSPTEAVKMAVQQTGLSPEPDYELIAMVLTENALRATDQAATQRRRSEARVNRSIRSMKASFIIMVVMHNTVFYLGVALVVLAAFWAFQGNAIAAALIGSVGLLELALFFLKEPVEGVHESIGDLLQLRAAYNSYFAQLDQWQLYYDNVSDAALFPTKRQIGHEIQQSTETTVQLVEHYTKGGTPSSEESRIRRFFASLRRRGKANGNVEGASDEA